MKKLEEMTRKELAEVIVDNQIERGIVEKENKQFQIEARLKGYARLRPLSKSELYKGAKAMINETKIK